MSELLLVRDVWSLDEIRNSFHSLSQDIRIEWKISDECIRNFSDVSRLQTWSGKKWTILVEPQLEASASCITNYFIEHVRVNARRLGHRSIAEDFLLNDWRRHYARKITHDSSMKQRYYAQQQSIAIALRYQVCETFPWSVGFALFRLFRPKRILDMSAGWGDRMLSAAACGVETYLGVDPNTKLANPYVDMIGALCPERSHDFRVITKAFEDMLPSDFEDEMFDMMFSSPPYYNAEAYSSDPAQSSARYAPEAGVAGIDNWLNGFMLPSIEIAWTRLHWGGMFIIVLNDNKEQHFTARALHHISTQPGAKYEGMLKYVVKGTPIVQPIWIFRKSYTLYENNKGGCENCGKMMLGSR
jgi:hypothetical protein